MTTQPLLEACLTLLETERPSVASDVGFSMVDLGIGMTDVGFGMADVGFEMTHVSFEMPVVSVRIVDVGFSWTACDFQNCE